MRPESSFTFSFLTGFVVQILLFTSIFFLGLYSVLTVSEEMEETLTRHYNKKTLLTQMRYANRERLLVVWAATLTEDPFDRIEHSDSLLNQGSLFLSANDKLQQIGMNNDEEQLFFEMREQMRSEGPRLSDIMQGLNNGKSVHLIKKDIASALPRQQAIQSRLDKIMDLQDMGIKDIQQTTRDRISNIIIITALLMFASYIIGSFYAYNIIRRSNSMVETIKVSQQELSDLNLELEQRVEQRTRQLKRANKRLEKMAKHDALTGLANRTYLYDLMNMQIALARRNKERLAVLFLDLDGFKEVNDQHGHAAGDNVLADVAESLKSIVRDTDLVARIGGDEFIIVMNGVKDISAIDSLAEKIISTVNNPIKIENTEITLGASIGISIYPDDAKSKKLLLKHADSSMYASKNKGENHFSYFKEIESA